MPGRRLCRSTRETKIAGVCGGLAEHFDIDPVLVRLGAVAITLAAPPLGVLAYLAGWMIMPLDSEVAADEAEAAASPPPPVGEGATPASSAPDMALPRGDPFPGAPPPGSPPAAAGRDGVPVAGVLLIALGALFLALNLGLFEWGIFRYFRWRYLWPSALILIGFWMIARAIGSAGWPGGRR